MIIRIGLSWIGAVALFVRFAPAQGPPNAQAGLEARSPVVEIEEVVYSYTPANNGAGPMWCAGSTSIVRTHDRVFATGLETLTDEQPLNNCRWVLYERSANGWVVRHRDDGRTREPAPLACFAAGQVIVSGNPTLAERPEPNGGPAKPELQFFPLDGHVASSDDPSEKPETTLPEWKGTPRFTEHSYRSLAADRKSNELIVFQNIGYAHSEWAFRDANGAWSAQGQLEWPWGADYAIPKPVRLCYPDVAIEGQAVHFVGVEDVTEPVPAWQEYKKELTGREWDYVFRRLYYTWTPDVTKQPFRNWIEIANVEATAGHLWPCDLWIGPAGEVHLLWSETAIDERLRPKFFPEARQARRLHHTVLRDGAIESSAALFESTEAEPGLFATRARFHVLPGNEVRIVAHVQGHGEEGETISENWIVRSGPGGKRELEQRIPFDKPFTNFFTATPRAGCEPSVWLDMLGTQEGSGLEISYARVKLPAP